MTSAVEFINVQKEFAGQPVINNLNLQINPGELFVLVGESGSGKTTTLKMINRLEAVTAGEILVNGKNADALITQELRWNLGYVLQQIALFPTMTVSQNIALIPEMQGMKKKDVAKLVDQLLAEVGLDPQEYRQRMPKDLSGGEQQRIGILRALAAHPAIVLMDEPFSALDPLSRQNLQQLVLKLHQQYQNTIIFVTHDMNEALKMGDRIAVMRQGQIEQVGTPTEIVKTPATDFVQAFFKNSQAQNVFDVYLYRVGLTQGYLAKPTVDNQAIYQLSGQAPLKSAFMALTEHQYIEVVDGDQFLGYLDQHQVIKYLNEYGQ